MPRQKITPNALEAAAAESGEELPKLTAKEFAFVEGLLDLKAAHVAYKDAYPESNAQLASMRALAARLANSPKIQIWLAASRKAYLGSAVVTIEGHVRELDRLKELALAAGNFGAAIQAENHKGKVSGLYIERYQDVTPPDPVRVLREVGKFAPEVAQQMAAQLGVMLEESVRKPPLELSAD